MTPAFGRVLTAMVTPFDADGTLDLAAAERVADHLMRHGNDGIVVAGTTGESPTVSDHEHGELLAAVLSAVGGRGPVIAGVGTNHTAHSVELAGRAARLGADGLLLVAPYYSRPSPAGIREHVGVVARATSVPVMLYDVPSRTGVRLEPALYEALRAHETVIAVKDSTADPARVALLSAQGYDVYSGDEAQTLGYLAYGGVGLVSVVAHVAGRELTEMIRLFLAGNHAGALDLHRRLTPATTAMMGVPNYGATTAKAALELTRVLDNRRVRGPLIALDEPEVAALRAGLAASGLL